MSEEYLQSIDYYAGLVDAVGRVSFGITQTDKRVIGYDAHPSIIFRVKQQDYLDATLGVFFDHHGIQYSFRREQTNSRYMIIEGNNSVRKLYQVLGDHLIQLSSQLSFVVESYLPARSSGKLASKEGHIGLMKSIAEIQPDRAENENTKYTPRFFASEFEIELASVPRIEIPTVTYPKKITTKYLAGFFDGRGRCSVAISENDDFSTGYSCSPRVKITRQQVNPNLKSRISTYLAEQEIHAKFYSQYHMMSVVIVKEAAICRLLEKIYPDLMVQPENVGHFMNNIIPRFQKNDHHTKQGLYEICKLAQPLHRSSTNNRRRYDFAYFEKIWEDELTIREWDEVIERPLSGPAEIPKPETHLPAIEITSTRRSSNPELRKAALDRFNRSCIITGLSDSRLLEVAHIVPWSENPEIGKDLSNTLILNPLHHEAYDRGLFVIDTEHVLHAAPDIDDKYMIEQLVERSGEVIHFPDSAAPASEYLTERNSEVSWWSG